MKLKDALFESYKKVQSTTKAGYALGESIGTDGLSDEQLTKYYESFGFKKTNGNNMKLKLY